MPMGIEYEDIRIHCVECGRQMIVAKQNGHFFIFCPGQVDEAVEHFSNMGEEISIELMTACVLEGGAFTRAPHGCTWGFKDLNPHSFYADVDEGDTGLFKNPVLLLEDRTDWDTPLHKIME